MTASASTSSGLSFVLPLHDDFVRRRTPRNAEGAGASGRGRPATVRAASPPEAGRIAFAPPPGALGYRTLWAMLLGLFIMRVLLSLIWP